jgi:MATE family multidrug resistance protein
MNGSQMVADYFYARIWAVPAGIMLFGLNGWFTGMQNAVIPMVTSIFINVLHVLLSLWFVFGADMGITGIAYASVVAQWSGMALSVVLLILFFRGTLRPVEITKVLKVSAMREFFSVNGDIIIRTFCIVAVYTFFTAASARMESDIVLAVNTMLLQMFTLFSYMNDGFAYAAEALTGRFIGARDRLSLKVCIKKCVVWAVGTAVVCITIYVFWWEQILSMFIGDKTQLPDMLSVAGDYIGWIIAIPVAAALPFLLDGIMVGATLTRILRNSMLLSTVAYFVLYYTLHPIMGNNALWLAFTAYMAIRGIAQYFMSDRLEMVYNKSL